MSGDALGATLREGVALRRVEEGIWSALPPEGEAQRYDDIAAPYDRLVSNRLYQRLMWGNEIRRDVVFAHEAIASRGGALLDAGCGTLVFTADAHLASERPTVLLDLSLGMLRRAKARLFERAGTLPARIVLLQADVLCLPFRPESFETVLCPGILHLFEDLDALLRGLHDVCQPGATLYISSLVSDRRFGHLVLRMGARRGEAATPRSAREVTQALEAIVGGPVDCRRCGNMASLSARRASPPR